jgi:cytochrome c-type biogenesis protein CcmH
VRADKVLRILCFSLLLLLPATHSYAVNPDEVLKDPALEERAREISKGLRCLVCQNQSIDDSDASLAKDLRVLVRERLVAGDSDDDVITYVVSRYGDFVLLKPPFKMATLVLWLGPLMLIVIGLVSIVVFYRRNQAPSAMQVDKPKPLSEDEQRRLEKLLKETDT